MIKKIYKKNIPQLIQSTTFWKDAFLPITKHRLYSLYMNPNCDDNDIVLLLAYLDDKLVGYMGVFIDIIIINNQEQKIGWLSTWWVHPKTKGTGIGRSLLNTMHSCFDGRIGVSQFTPSAKRVYLKSNYFDVLKKSKGYKFVFRSNLSIILPLINNKLHKFNPFFAFLDYLINIPINIKNSFHHFFVNRKLTKLNLEYVNIIDNELMSFIKQHNKNHLSQKSSNFFSWLKAYHWVQESPLNNFCDLPKYQFSMGSEKFNIYLIKILKNNVLIGFLVLQRKNHLLKILFSYLIKGNEEVIAYIILSHSFKLKIRELVCYDNEINSIINSSAMYIYKKQRIKESIISKSFNFKNSKSYKLNFGDGDCCFA